MVANLVDVRVLEETCLAAFLHIIVEISGGFKKNFVGFISIGRVLK